MFLNSLEYCIICTTSITSIRPAKIRTQYLWDPSHNRTEWAIGSENPYVSQQSTRRRPCAGLMLRRRRRRRPSIKPAQGRQLKIITGSTPEQSGSPLHSIPNRLLRDGLNVSPPGSRDPLAEFFFFTSVGCNYIFCDNVPVIGKNEIRWIWFSATFVHIWTRLYYRLNWVRRTTRHRIQNSNPGGLRPSSLLLGHGSSPQYWILTSE